MNYTEIYKTIDNITNKLTNLEQLIIDNDLPTTEYFASNLDEVMNTDTYSILKKDKLNTLIWLDFINEIKTNDKKIKNKIKELNDIILEEAEKLKTITTNQVEVVKFLIKDLILVDADRLSESWNETINKILWLLNKETGNKIKNNEILDKILLLDFDLDRMSSDWVKIYWYILDILNID